MDMNASGPSRENTTTAQLAADKSTGEQPMELFITDEHTEHYLALSSGGDTDRGQLAGLGGWVALGMLCLQVLLMLKGKWEGVLIGLILAGALFLVPFLWEVLRPLPLPTLFNRRTREVYFDHDGELFHTPWDGVAAVANEFQMVGPSIGSIQSASLEIRVWQFENPENALMVRLGSPFGKSLAMQKGLWEYIRAYMNNGPWFDEYGNHSESDAFVKSQLGIRANMSGWFQDTVNCVKQKKADNAGKNYLSGRDVIMMAVTFLLFPWFRIQEFTYSVAKRRSRNLWPSIVNERLKADGPVTRLIDLEREKGEFPHDPSR